MRKARKIAIISRDTLRAVGLRNLLAAYFAPVETDLLQWQTQGQQWKGYDFCFIDRDLVRGDEIPEGCRVIRLSSGAAESEEPEVLDVSAELKEIHDCLDALLAPAGTIEKRDACAELTRREIEVLRQVVSGAINKEIADRLSISFNTVLTHRKHIAAKTGIRTVSGLTLYAIFHGYVSPGEIGI